jgi:hypothetical protein
MQSYMDAVIQLYQPNLDAMRNSLPDLGQSLNVAAIDLARDCTVERLDLLLARLQGAETALVHLRKALIADKSGVQRGGTG